MAQPCKVVLHVSCVALLVIGAMGRCRSYIASLVDGKPLTASQLKRQWRDRHFYKPSQHSISVSLDPALHKSGKSMLAGLQLHQTLADSIQMADASAKRVAHAAFKSDAITRAQLQSARDVLTNADAAKHLVVPRLPRFSSWADADVDDNDSFSFRGDAANVGTQVEDIKNEPATKREGPIGLTANAPVFVPTPAPVRDSSLDIDSTAGFNVHIEGSFIPTIGQQLDYMLASNFMGQGQQGG